MEARKITLEEVRQLHFTHDDVLTTFEDRFEREHKLKTAMALTNIEHESIKIIAQLKNGELIEVHSHLIDLEDDYVEVAGGIGIPLKAIVDVGV
jgi:carbonic anhydrase